MKEVVCFISSFTLTQMDYSAIKHTKSLGYETAMMVDSTYAEDVSYVDYVIYSNTHNMEIVITDLAQFQLTHKLAAILTYSDMHVEVTAAACNYYGLYSSSLASIQSCKNKYLCRIKQTDCGWLQPKCRLIKTVEDFRKELNSVGVPAVLKPLNGVGAAFTVFIDKEKVAEEQFLLNKSSFENSFLDQEMMVSDYWVLEEYLDGFQISVESFTYDGKTTIVCIHDKLNPILPPHFRVEYSATPSPRINDQLADEISILTIKALEVVNYQYGVAHTEFRITDKGPQLLEINTRTGGGLIIQSAYYSTGVNLFVIAVDIALGRKPDVKVDHNNPTVFKVVYPLGTGLLTTLCGFEALKNNKAFDVVMQTSSVGDIVTPSSRIGLVLSSSKQNESVEDLIDNINQGVDTLLMEIDHINLDDSAYLPGHIETFSRKKPIDTN